MSQGFGAVDESDHVSVAIVEAVAEAEGVQPAELTPPLYDVVDTDALDRLFAPNSQRQLTEGTTRFTYNGYTVTVEADGEIRVEE